MAWLLASIQFLAGTTVVGSDLGRDEEDRDTIQLVKRIVPGDSIGPLPPDDPLEEGGDEPDVIVAPPPFYMEKTPWSGSVGLLILQRASVISGPVLQNVNNPLLLSDYGAFGFNWAPGVDFRIARYFGYGDSITGWDVRTFWLGNLNSQTTYYFDGQWTLPNSPITGTSASFYSSYSSSFYSAEFNLEREAGNPTFTWLGGFRWLQLNDGLQGTTLFSSGDTLDFLINTQNNLYGGQVGMGLNFPGANIPIEVSARAKAGLFGNGANGQIQVIDTSAAGRHLSTLNGSGLRTAFVGEIDVMLNYRLTRNLGIQIGYDVLWLSGAAIAGSQPAVPDPQLSNIGYNENGRAFFYGAQLGLTFGW